MTLPNSPIVNAPNLFIDGLVVGTAGSSSFMQVGTGSSRDSTNTNDMILENYTLVNGKLTGANGIDKGFIAPNQIYGIFIIGNSTDYNSTAIILSAVLTPLIMPQGYDMFRRIGWCGTDTVAYPETSFLKWYQFGSGQNRKYYYDIDHPLAVASSATAYTALPSTSTPAPGYACPPLNTTVILQTQYTAGIASNTAEFMPFGSPGAAAGEAGIIRIGAGQSGTSQNNPIEVPCIYDPITNKSLFLYRVSSGDQITISAVGFYDYL